MTSTELVAIAEKYNMRLISDYYTDRLVGVYAESEEELPELEAICENPTKTVSGTCIRHYYEDGSMYLLYQVYCPNDWCIDYYWTRQ